MIVIFDRQHYGKPNRNDVGATFDLDRDGLVETQEMEANITPYYYLPAKKLLEERGHSAIVLDYGWYKTRHEKANAIARANPGQRVAYLACHVNAGMGDYAAFIHDSRSAGGKELSEALAYAFRSPPLRGIRRALVRAGSPSNGWKNGYYTVAGIWAGPSNISGTCLEPFFLDRAEHQWLASVDGGVQIARRLVRGLLRWAGEAT
jgi:hypothetical protein